MLRVFPKLKKLNNFITSTATFMKFIIFRLLLYHFRFSISQINDYKDELKALGVNPETEFTNSERVIIIAFDKVYFRLSIDIRLIPLIRPRFTQNSLKNKTKIIILLIVF